MKDKTVWLMLAGIIVFQLLNNAFWCSHDWLTIEDDIINHLQSHLRIYSGLKDVSVSSSGLLEKFSAVRDLFISSSDSQYPPLFYFLTASFNLFLGDPSLVITRMANMFYFALLVISVYSIGRQIFSPGCGLISAFLVSFYPAVAGYSRQYGLDFPLTCMIAFCIYCLLRTRYFSDLYRSVVFGAAAGLAILTKGQALLFLIVPVIYALIAGIAGSSGKKRVLPFAGFLFAAAVAAALSGIWWLPRFNLLVDKLIQWTFVSFSGHPVPENLRSVMALKRFSPDWLLSYAYFSLNNISPVLFCLFVLGWTGFRTSRNNDKYLLLVWLAASYAILTGLEIKCDRFFMPAFPAMAIVSGSFFEQFKSRPLRHALICVVLGFAVFQLMFLSYSPESWLLKNPRKDSLFYVVNPMTRPRVYGDQRKKSFYELICVSPTYSSIKDNLSGIIAYLNRKTSAADKSVYFAVPGYTEAGIQVNLIAYLIRSANTKIKLYWYDRAANECDYCEQLPPRQYARIASGKYDFVLLVVLDRKPEAVPSELSSEKLAELLPLNKDDIRGRFRRVSSGRWNVRWGISGPRIFEAFLYERDPSVSPETGKSI